MEGRKEGRKGDGAFDVVGRVLMGGWRVGRGREEEEEEEEEEEGVRACDFLSFASGMERKGEERRGKERKGKERKGKKRKGKERKRKKSDLSRMAIIGFGFWFLDYINLCFVMRFCLIVWVYIG